MKEGSRKWSVKLDPKAEASMPTTLTEMEKARIITWAETVERYGPQILEERPLFWHDHALEGEWAGCRASNFSDVGRIIYRVEESIITVVVLKITDTHDYRRN